MHRREKVLKELVATEERYVDDLNQIITGYKDRSSSSSTLLDIKLQITHNPVSFLDSTAVSIFVVILVELTNTETALVSPPRALLNFQKATNQRGVLSCAFFL